MSLAYYIKINHYDSNEYHFGVMTVIDEKPVDYKLGMRISKNELHVLNDIAKLILSKDEFGDKSKPFTIKYDTLEQTKQMKNIIANDSFYSNYKIQVLPAVFLSDLKKLTNLDKKLKVYNSMRNYIKQSILKGNEK